MFSSVRIRFVLVSLWIALGNLYAQQPQPMQMASLRPNVELRWQRVSPSIRQPDGPVLYQLLFRAAGTPGSLARFDTNPRHLTNSLITDNGSMVAIGGLSISSAGLISFAAGQTFTLSTGTELFQTGGAGTVGVAVQGANAQTANLQEWRNGAGAALASVSATGVFSGPGADFTASNSSQVLNVIQNSTGHGIVSSISGTTAFQTAILGISNASTGATFGVEGITKSTDPNGIGVLGQAFANGGVAVEADSFGANAVSGFFYNNAGGVLISAGNQNGWVFSVDNSGKVTSSGMTTTGTVSAGSITISGTVSAGSITTSGTVTAAGLTMGGGATIANTDSIAQVVCNSSCTFTTGAGTVPANSCHDFGPLTIPGTTTSMIALVSPAGALQTGWSSLEWMAYIPAANSYMFHYCNPTPASVTVALQTFNARVIK